MIGFIVTLIVEIGLVIAVNKVDSYDRPGLHSTLKLVACFLPAIIFTELGSIVAALIVAPIAFAEGLSNVLSFVVEIAFTMLGVYVDLKLFQKIFFN